MEKIIVYKSNTGFTEQYAKWISEETGIKCVNIKNINVKSLSSYDQVIYGESLFGGMLMNYKKIRKYNSNIITFAVGLTQTKDIDINLIKQKNQIDGELYYLIGGAKLDKLKFVPRAILKKVSGIKESVDYSKKEYIVDIIKEIKEE